MQCGNDGKYCSRRGTIWHSDGWACFLGTSNVSVDWRTKNAGDTVMTKYPSRLYPRLLYTDEKQELRYLFRLVRNWYVGTPLRGPKRHSEKLI